MKSQIFVADLNQLFLEDDFDLEKLPKVSKETGDLIPEDSEIADEEEKQGPQLPKEAK